MNIWKSFLEFSHVHTFLSVPMYISFSLHHFLEVDRESAEALRDWGWICKECSTDVHFVEGRRHLANRCHCVVRDPLNKWTHIFVSKIIYAFLSFKSTHVLSSEKAWSCQDLSRCSQIPWVRKQTSRIKHLSCHFRDS